MSQTQPASTMHVPPVLAAYGRTVPLPRSRTELFCYDAGSRDSPAVLLVHGLGDEADSWRRVIGPLSSSHRVIAPDLPGFGRSPRVRRRRLSPPFLAGALLELLDALDVRRVVVVGSSLGASLAQVIALRAPDRVARLVLVDGGLLARARLSSSLLLSLVPWLGEKRYRSLSRNIDAAYASLMPYYGSLSALPAEERDFLRRRVAERVVSETQMRAYFAFFRGYFRWMFFRGRGFAERARKLGIDTLYVWGARDHIIPVSSGQEALTRHVDGGRAVARLEIIAEAGHLPHQESPREFLRLLS